jgi:two-component system sensor histidine kinase UhpB
MIFVNLPDIKNVFITISMLFISLFELKAQAPDFNQYPDPKARLNAIYKYGRECIIKQKFDEAVHVFGTGVAIAQQFSLDSFAAGNLLYTATTYRYKSIYDSALYYLQQAQKIADRNNYLTLRAGINLEFFGIYNRIGRADSATAKINYLESMIPGLDSNGSERAKIEWYLGHTNKHKAKYTESLQHYYKALRIFNYLKDSVNIAGVYSSIANILELWQQDKGLVYHWEAAKILTRIGRRSELAGELLDITDTYYSLNKLDSAEMTVKQALSIANELNDKTYQAYAYMHLGHINKLRKQFAKAENYFRLSIQLGEQAGVENDLYECYQGLGETYMAELQPGKAKNYLEKYLSIIKENKNREEIIEAYADLKENEYNLHNYAKAHEYEKQYNAYKDSAYNESVSKSTAEMESKYQNEKKEQEIVLLKKDQELKNVALQKERTIKLSAFTLAALLAVIGFLFVNRYRVIQKAKRMVEIEKLRNNIARDLHDDIGSVLSSININSKMALTNSAEERIVKGQLEKIKEHSGKMMEGMSDIVWAINPINDSLEKMIIRMKEFAVEILEPLNINFVFNYTGDIAEASLDISRRKELYMVFKEAVNNAAKYSDCKNIIINLEANKNHILLIISDDGKGFSRSRIGSGNGLRNMEQRTAAISGNIEIASAPGKGTKVRLDIPIA